MAEVKVKTAEEVALNGTDEEVKERLQHMVKVDRRVVSRKETLGYMLFDGSKDFNINSQKELFVDSVLKIGLGKQAIFQAVAGIWDVFDDIIIGGIVEKTRTRWGKFIPYLFVTGFPLAVVTTIYWLMPALFSQVHVNDLNYIPKFIAYIVLELLIETFGNFRDVATQGYLSTITPYPSDRRRLLAITKYFSLFYSELPNFIIEFMLDFITNGIIKSTKRSSDEMIKLALMILGPFSTIVVGIVVTWYSTVAKERVHQSVHSPKIIESLKIVFSNKPVLMYLFSNALGSFGTGINTNSYYRWVLFWTTFETIAGIPSVFFQPIGYAKYGSLSAKHSTKALYMISTAIPKGSYIPVFLYGLLLKDKQGNAFFTKRAPMLIVTAIWECVYATFSGIRRVSSDEIRNECNDYIEWKCGHRNEATISVASTILCKIPNRVNGIIQPLIKKWIGYDQTAYAERRPQPVKAQKWIFAMATLFPAIITVTGVLPMLGYGIDKKTRDQMYMELNARRIDKATAVNAGEDDEEGENAV